MDTYHDNLVLMWRKVKEMDKKQRREMLDLISQKPGSIVKFQNINVRQGDLVAALENPYN